MPIDEEENGFDLLHNEATGPIISQRHSNDWLLVIIKLLVIKMKIKKKKTQFMYRSEWE